MPRRSQFDEATLPLFAAPAPPKPPSYLKDHRQRLRHRFLTGGAAAMPDYELLELILFRAIPRQDVKPLARALLETFGDFQGVMAADAARLGEIRGMGTAAITEIKVVEAAAQRLSQARMLHRHVIDGWDALIAYCRASMARKATETFRILFLDRKNILIADEVQARGTVDHVPVYPREIVKRALALDATALILVHNHPSGDPTPSDADITMTAEVQRAADALGIVLHDHLVIGQASETSFRAEGLL